MSLLGWGVMNNVAWLLIITSRDLYLSALSYIIATIDHSSRIADILWRYVWIEVIGDFSSLSVRAGDIERDVDYSINDYMELRDTH